MKIQINRYVFDRPKKRPLKIFASDPMAGKSMGNRVTVDVENEKLQPGPHGERLSVVDFNATTQKYYPPIDLDDADVLMQGGLSPTESDPRFHQQMVYAVAMRTLENFDKALGRRIQIASRGKQLRLFPHAFNAANAYFDSDLNAILFGYFRADKTNPGNNLPGQTVFTCLSHDIIAHEVTHAVVHRLRKHLLEPSNVDVLAFHEAFADLVALFQHFSFPEVLKQQIHSTGSNLREAHGLLGMAPQFGHATAMGQALRSGLNDPKIMLSDDLTEPHERGAVLVAAVFDAFIKIYETRTADLLRLSPSTSLHPDLVNRLAAEAARIAQNLLTICIRAFDYLPPVDVTFGDFLRSLVTADMELSPEDELGTRAALIDGFRLRGIYPEGVTSLAEESLVWEPSGDEFPELEWDAGELLNLIVDAATQLTNPSHSFGTSSRNLNKSWSNSTESQYAEDNKDDTAGIVSGLARVVHRYAKDNADRLMLDSKLPIQALGVHPVFRVAPSGRLVIELVAQVAQRAPEDASDGPFPLRGGTTLIVSFDGSVKYAIAKPLASGAPPGQWRSSAESRAKKQTTFLHTLAAKNPHMAYASDGEFRLKLRDTFRHLHASR